MTNDALINGKVQIISDEEKKGAAEFHKKRYPFIWINGKLTFNDNMNDDRDHQHWVCEDYGISVEEFEKSPRGYMLPGRIQLFIGSDFSCIPLHQIEFDDIDHLISVHKSLYPDTAYQIFNGVKVGKIGEIWPPIEELIVSVENKYLWRKRDLSPSTDYPLGPIPAFSIK